MAGDVWNEDRCACGAVMDEWCDAHELCDECCGCDLPG